jgi:hypothetical protein
MKSGEIAPVIRSGTPLATVTSACPCLPADYGSTSGARLQRESHNTCNLESLFHEDPATVALLYLSRMPLSLRFLGTPNWRGHGFAAKAEFFYKNSDSMPD